MVRGLAAEGVPVSTACRVLQVSPPGSYEWQGRGASAGDLEQARLVAGQDVAHALGKQWETMRRHAVPTGRYTRDREWGEWRDQYGVDGEPSSMPTATNWALPRSRGRKPAWGPLHLEPNGRPRPVRQSVINLTTDASAPAVWVPGAATHRPRRR